MKLGVGYLPVIINRYLTVVIFSSLEQVLKLPPDFVTLEIVEFG